MFFHKQHPSRHRSARKWVKPAVFLLILFAYLPTRLILQSFDERLLAPVTFVHLHALQADNASPLPASVFLTGRFSDWLPDDSHYRMAFDGTNRYTITLELEPGRHPYSFALHYPPEAPGQTNRIVYAGDPRATTVESFDDGSRRPVHIVRTIQGLREIIDFFFIALIAGLLLFTLLRKGINRLMYLRISLRYKLIAIFIFFLIASNLFFIRLSTIQRADFARFTQTDIVNTIHTMLLSEGIDFANIANRYDMQYFIRERLERFFRSARLREDYNTWANNKIQLTRIAILDTNGRPLLNVTSESLLSFLRTHFAGDSALEKYFANLTKRAFEGYRRSPFFPKSTFAFPIFDYFTDDMKERSGEENIDRYRQATAFFEDNGFITPIQTHHKLSGYYFFEANGKSYSTLFQSALIYNLILLAVIALLYFLLMKRTMAVMLGPLLALIEGIRMVDKGRFDYNIDISTHDEIEALGKAYNFMRERIHESRNEIEHYTRHLESEIEKRTRELKRANAVYKEDLFLARQLQQQMLTSEKIPALPGIGLDISYNALAEVGGDFYCIFAPRKNCLRVFLADATGHGVPAALVTMLIKSEYEKVKMLDDPVDILHIINDSFLSTYGSLTVFFTGIIIDIDQQRSLLKFVSAGHPVQYLVRGHDCLRLSGRGRIIGVVSDPLFATETRPLEPDDRLLLFTDGLLEQINSGGEEYGEHRLLALLADDAARLSPQELNRRILDDQAAFRGIEDQVDDMTLISIHCQPRPGSEP